MAQYEGAGSELRRAPPELHIPGPPGPDGVHGHHHMAGVLLHGGGDHPRVCSGLPGDTDPHEDRSRRGGQEHPRRDPELSHPQVEIPPGEVHGLPHPQPPLPRLRICPGGGEYQHPRGDYGHRSINLVNNTKAFRSPWI